MEPLKKKQKRARPHKGVGDGLLLVQRSKPLYGSKTTGRRLWVPLRDARYTPLATAPAESPTPADRAPHSAHKRGIPLPARGGPSSPRPSLRGRRGGGGRAGAGARGGGAAPPAAARLGALLAAGARRGAGVPAAAREPRAAGPEPTERPGRHLWDGGWGLRGTRAPPQLSPYGGKNGAAGA